LTRGIHPLTHKLISPKALFNQAVPMGVVLELDRLCRKTVLENFREIQKKEPDAILSLNFEASIIDQGVVGSGSLIQQVQSLGISPQSVAIEIIESNVEDIEALQKFIHTYRQYGFLIALDDVGAGHSNLNRIPLLKPDILKIDQYLVHVIVKDFYKQEIFKSLVNLAHKIGALIVSEGIETEDEALFVTELGVDMMQGYYFYKPQPKEEIKNHVVSYQVRDFQAHLKAALFEKLKIKDDNFKKHERMTRKIQSELAKSTIYNFDAKLLEVIHHFPSVECLYVLDKKGIQVSDTVFSNAGLRTKNRLMFRPAEKKTDHSMKDFYYMLFNAGHRRSTFVTEPYISLATGNSCVTFCRVFKDGEGVIRVLCVDINNDYLRLFS
jgi:EAL domain-containing protein (putative c-di-GMP-specific phosphodiesterase class I)